MQRGACRGHRPNRNISAIRPRRRSPASRRKVEIDRVKLAGGRKDEKAASFVAAVQLASQRSANARAPCSQVLLGTARNRLGDQAATVGMSVAVSPSRCSRVPPTGTPTPPHCPKCQMRMITVRLPWSLTSAIETGADIAFVPKDRCGRRISLTAA
jgi:hypothetical protein